MIFFVSVDRSDCLLRVDSFQKLSTTIFIVDRLLLSMITPTKMALLSKSQMKKRNILELPLWQLLSVKN